MFIKFMDVGTKIINIFAAILRYDATKHQILKN